MVVPGPCISYWGSLWASGHWRRAGGFARTVSHGVRQVAGLFFASATGRSFLFRDQASGIGYLLTGSPSPPRRGEWERYTRTKTRHKNKTQNTIHNAKNTSAHKSTHTMGRRVKPSQSHLTYGFNCVTWALLIITPVSGLANRTTLGLTILSMIAGLDHLCKSLADIPRTLELATFIR